MELQNLIDSHLTTGDSNSKSPYEKLKDENQELKKMLDKIKEILAEYEKTNLGRQA